MKLYKLIEQLNLIKDKAHEDCEIKFYLMDNEISFMGLELLQHKEDGHKIIHVDLASSEQDMQRMANMIAEFERQRMPDKSLN